QAEKNSRTAMTRRTNRSPANAFLCKLFIWRVAAYGAHGLSGGLARYGDRTKNHRFAIAGYIGKLASVPSTPPVSHAGPLKCTSSKRPTGNCEPLGVPMTKSCI